MTALAWFLVGAAIVLLGIAVGKFLRLADDMDRARADLDGDEIDGGWLFDAPYPRTRNNAAGEKGEGGAAAGHLVQCNKSEAGL